MVEAKNTAGQWLYPHRILPDSTTPEAVALLRRTLAVQPDGSVVVVVVGFSTNLARLLDSPPDAASPLSGRDLVAQKVKFLSMMAGHFAGESPSGAGEYNVIMDLPAARKVLQAWPTPIYIAPYELGVQIAYPASSIEKDYAYVPHHPIAEAYRLYIKFPYDRPTWDLISVLFGVLPERGYFTLSPAGKVRVNETGRTSFEATATGAHHILSCNPAQTPRVLEAMIQLCSQPPHAD
jgi:inosine-uridine nucleoside N-ribohydrolase